MQVEYKNDKLRKVCTIAYYAQRQYGEKMSYKIHQRIDELRAASSVEELLKFHIGDVIYYRVIEKANTLWI